MRLGVIGGYPDGSYGPQKTLTRAQMAQLMGKAATLVSGDKLTGTKTFSDSTSSWASGVISYCADHGIVSGTSATTYTPNGSVTVLQTAKMLLSTLGVTGFTADNWASLAESEGQKAGLFEGVSGSHTAAATRDDAARMIYNALKGSDGKNTLPALNFVNESSTVSTLTVPANSVAVVPYGKMLTLTVNGVETRYAPGAAYTGKVVVTLTDVYTVSNMGMDSNLRMAAYIKDGALVSGKSVSSAIMQGTVTGSEAKNVVINSQNDEFSGIVVDGNTTYNISNIKITMNGHGRDDFAGTSAGITARGTSNVTVDNADINTTGSIRTAIWAGENAKLLVKNSKIVGKDGDNVNFKFSMMNEVPWILGLVGNLRATNVLGAAQATYLNCYVEAENWGALSTDSTSDGAKLTAINTDIVISGKSGYGSYSDQKVQNAYYGCRFSVPDYALVVAAGNCGAVFGPATKANTGDLYDQITSAKKDSNTVVNAGRFGVMWHKNQNGTVSVQPGTVFNTGSSAFVVKSDVGNTAYPNLVVDGATVNAKNGVLFQLMESDDPGMNFAGGGPGSSDMWMPYYEVPVVKPVKDANDTTKDNETTVHTSFKNMTVAGSIFNSRWTAGQNLSVALENTKLTGVISSGTQHHTNVQPGEKITKANYYEIGNVTIDPTATVSNGLLLSLDKTTVWTVTGTSYVSSLTLAQGASIQAPAGKTVTMTVNGTATPIAAGTYTGAVVLTVK